MFRLDYEYTPIQKKLLTDEIIFSAHYFGSMEIPYSKNMDNCGESARSEGSEKSRFVMNKLKKEIRDLADVTQIVMKINMAGVNIFDSKTKVSGHQSVSSFSTEQAVLPSPAIF